MNDAVYRLRGVAKTYQQRQVLSIDHLDIQPGEVFAIVGPSGSGKSTLLRMLNFLEPPSQGEIIYKGRRYGPEGEMDIELRRQVTTVFQHPRLLNRSVWANVQYGLRLRGQRDARATTEAALEQVGLLTLARQRARTLSGGEAQRVALARAIALDPDVLLLDEPTANLDPYNVALIEETIQQINRQRGTTIVLVTHNIFQARRLAQRVALLLEGKIIEVQPVAQFFETPKDARTASFVRGEMVY